MSNLEMIKYSMVCPNGGPIFRFSDLIVFVRRLQKRFFTGKLDISDNLKDRNLPFTEYPSCEACGSEEAHEVLLARDGNRVVECNDCGLWFTSPRVPEHQWNRWLLQLDSDRNVEFTENRLRYGVALSRNIKYSFSFWWRIKRYQYQKIIKKILHILSGNGLKLHDVGCGVGFLLKSAKDLGLKVSGNDLNTYAVKKIREILDVEVYDKPLTALISNNLIKCNTYDIVTMLDFIEHSYHPLSDLKAAHLIMQKGGILYIRTFCIDSEPFKKHGKNYDMLMWNHTFHFSSHSLTDLIKSAKFEILQTNYNKSQGIIEVLARNE